MSDELVIAGKKFNSRLIVGTGRYRTMEEMVAAVEASGTEMITVAIRRLDLDDPTSKTLLDYIDWGRYQMLPNTAGCATANSNNLPGNKIRQWRCQPEDSISSLANRSISTK